MASFASLPNGYAMDSTQGYHRDKLPSKDLSSFRSLGTDDAKTATQVYYRGGVFAGADAATFELLQSIVDDADAKDAGARYRLGQRVARR